MLFEDFDAIQLLISKRYHIEDKVEPQLIAMTSSVDIHSKLKVASPVETKKIQVSNICHMCGIGCLNKQTSGDKLVCNHCGLMDGYDKDENDDKLQASSSCLASGSTRIRIVGVNSKLSQASLYKNSAMPTCKMLAWENTLSDFQKLISIYNEKCVREEDKMPIEACRLASDMYREIQEQCVKRSENKRSIMAACYYMSCLQHGWAISKSSLTAVMNLQSGPAKGTNFVNELRGRGFIDSCPKNIDYNNACLTLVFKCMKIDDEPYCNDLYQKTVYMLNVLDANKVAYTSQQKTKACGMTYNVIKRYFYNKHINHPTSIKSSTGSAYLSHQSQVLFNPRSCLPHTTKLTKLTELTELTGLTEPTTTLLQTTSIPASTLSLTSLPMSSTITNALTNKLPTSVKDKTISSLSPSGEKLFESWTLTDYVSVFPTKYIMVGTILSLLHDITNYHSRFTEAYVTLGLDSSKIIFTSDTTAAKKAKKLNT